MKSGKVPRLDAFSFSLEREFNAQPVAYCLQGSSTLADLTFNVILRVYFSVTADIYGLTNAKISCVCRLIRNDHASTTNDQEGLPNSASGKRHSKRQVKW